MGVIYRGMTDSTPSRRIYTFLAVNCGWLIDHDEIQELTHRSAEFLKSNKKELSKDGSLKPHADKQVEALWEPTRNLCRKILAFDSLSIPTRRRRSRFVMEPNNELADLIGTVCSYRSQYIKFLSAFLQDIPSLRSQYVNDTVIDLVDFMKEHDFNYIQIANMFELEHELSVSLGRFGVDPAITFGGIGALLDFVYDLEERNRMPLFSSFVSEAKKNTALDILIEEMAEDEDTFYFTNRFDDDESGEKFKRYCQKVGCWDSLLMAYGKTNSIDIKRGAYKKEFHQLLRKELTGLTGFSKRSSKLVSMTPIDPDPGKFGEYTFTTDRRFLRRGEKVILEIKDQAARDVIEILIHQSNTSDGWITDKEILEQLSRMGKKKRKISEKTRLRDYAFKNRSIDAYQLLESEKRYSEIRGDTIIHRRLDTTFRAFK